MSNIAYVNGSYELRSKAAVSIEDRGYQFADGAYAVIALYHGKLIDFDKHYQRFKDSLAALDIEIPLSKDCFSIVLKELIIRNRLNNKRSDGIIYAQVSRGSSRRAHNNLKNSDLTPNIAITITRTDFSYLPNNLKATKIITLPDNRWANSHIKSISLLAAVLAKKQAAKECVDDTWFYDNNRCITEGASNNAWIVDENGILRTHHVDNKILNGITRRRVLDLIKADESIKFKEEPFTVEEAHKAKEAFSTAAVSFVHPVTEIDGREINGGQIGPVTKKIAKLYHQFMIES